MLLVGGFIVSVVLGGGLNVSIAALSLRLLQLLQLLQFVVILLAGERAEPLPGEGHLARPRPHQQVL